MLAATIDIIDDTGSAAERRAAGERIVVDRPSTLRADGAPLDIAVRDLSPRGFQFNSDRGFPIGATVRLGLGGAGTQDARIVRRDGAAFGCVFIEPLSAPRMAAAFTAAAVVRGVFGDGEAAPAVAGASAKWPGAVRVAFLVGSSIALWTGLLAATGLAFR